MIPASRLAHLLCLVAAPLLALAPAAAQRAQTVAQGANIEWSQAENGSPARYRSGPFSLTMRGERDPEIPEYVVPVLTVGLPGHAPARVEGSLSSANFHHLLTVGRWDAERPFVMFQSFTGGAHCCNRIQLIYPENGRLQVVELGTWDGDYLEQVPSDLDGDGRLDFVFIDNAFLYAFAPYAMSTAPPQIMNVEDGRAVDVSTRPAFRPLFAEAMAGDREGCVQEHSNSACAAYVASAARLGQFEQAWAEMLQSHDPNYDWTYPAGCRIEVTDRACPEDQAIEFDNYPDALRAFLVEQGYLPR